MIEATLRRLRQEIDTINSELRGVTINSAKYNQLRSQLQTKQRELETVKWNSKPAK